MAIGKHFILVLLTFAGGILSCYLILHHVRLSNGCLFQPSSCSIAPGINCDVVAASSYATWFGIPVASFGLLYYVVLLLLIVFVFQQNLQHNPEQARIQQLPLGLSALGLLGSIYFAAISTFVIRSLCLNCSGTYLVNVLTFSILFFSLPQGQRLVALQQSIASGVQFFSDALLFRSGRVGRITLLVCAVVAVFSISLPSWLRPYACDSRILAASAKAVQDWHQTAVIPSILATQNLNGVDFSDGPSEAPITIVVFSDFACPHCRLAARTLHTIRELHPQTVRVVFKNFPLDSACNPGVTKSFHRYSCRAALFARCAGVSTPQVFWQMHDGIFNLEHLSEASLVELTRKFNLPISDFEHCLSNPQSIAPISADIQQARELGLNGTPAVFINGKQLSEPLLSAIQEIVSSLEPKIQESNN